jgi:hypothetical protein
MLNRVSYRRVPDVGVPRLEDGADAETRRYVAPERIELPVVIDPINPLLGVIEQPSRRAARNPLVLRSAIRERKNREGSRGTVCGTTDSLGPPGFRLSTARLPHNTGDAVCSELHG